MGQCILQNQAGGGMNATLLWTNPNPNSNMTDTTIYLNAVGTEGYNYLYFLFKNSTSSSAQVLDSMFSLVDGSNPYRNNISVTNSSGTSFTRYISYKINNLTRIYVAKCYNNDNGGRKDDFCIPIKIFGIKGKINGIEK